MTERKDEPYDVVQRARHYNLHPSGVECIDLVEGMPFNVGNGIKYIWRAGLKTADRRQDIEKAIWYFKREQARGRQSWWRRIVDGPRFKLTVRERALMDLVIAADIASDSPALVVGRVLFSLRASMSEAGVVELPEFLTAAVAECREWLREQETRP